MGCDEKFNKFHKGGTSTKDVPQCNTKTVITEAFEKYAKELEFKQDKYERIVKLSRDTTIASKRAIFSLHALMRSDYYEKDLAKITESLKTIRNTQLKSIALELGDEDPYQYCRAYTAGLQEYIEAITFYKFITEGTLFQLQELKNDLIFENKLELEEQGDTPSIKNCLMVELFDYILGVQDTTGEIMRHCINSFGARNLNSGQSDCNFVKKLYSAMIVLSMNRGCIGWHHKEFYKKMDVALTSLKKMEMACYTIQIRGSEALID